MLKLKVPDMSCAHCVGVIEKAVRKVDPGARVTADLAAGTVAVETSAGAEAVRAAMSAAGYESTKLAA